MIGARFQEIGNRKNVKEFSSKVLCRLSSRQIWLPPVGKCGRPDMKTNHVHVVHRKSQDSRGTPCSENLQHCQSSLWHDHFHLSGCFQANPNRPMSKNQYHWMGHVDHIQIILGQSTVSLGGIKGVPILRCCNETLLFDLKYPYLQIKDLTVGENLYVDRCHFKSPKLQAFCCINSSVNCLPRVTGPVYLLPEPLRIRTVETSTFTNFRYRSMSGKAAEASCWLKNG